MTQFNLVSDARASGTALVSEIIVSPAALVAAFGAPGKADRHKSSGQYVFENDEGDVFTVYDWKMTSLYEDDGVGNQSPGAFWSRDEPIQFNIGGKSGSGEFEEWLHGEIERLKARYSVAIVTSFLRHEIAEIRERNNLRAIQKRNAERMEEFTESVEQEGR